MLLDQSVDEEAPLLLGKRSTRTEEDEPRTTMNVGSSASAA
jgi:hypothetical protein